MDIPSFRRAAESFEALTQVPLSKSSLAQLVWEYGERVAEGQEQEAEELAGLPEGELRDALERLGRAVLSRPRG